MAQHAMATRGSETFNCTRQPLHALYIFAITGTPNQMPRATTASLNDLVMTPKRYIIDVRKDSSKTNWRWFAGLSHSYDDDRFLMVDGSNYVLLDQTTWPTVALLYK